MVEKDLSSSSGLDNFKQRRNTISWSFGNKRSTKIPQRWIKLRQTVLKPPSWNSTRIILSFFFRCPYENTNHSTCSNTCCKCRVILYPQISSEPNYAASTTWHLLHTRRKIRVFFPFFPLPFTILRWNSIKMQTLINYLSPNI